MRLPVTHDLSTACSVLDLRTKDRDSPSPLRLDGRKSENAFRRLVNLRAETRKPNLRVLIKVGACLRTVSPSLHSGPASGGASSFLLASALP